MTWLPKWWRVFQRDVDATTPVENAFVDHVRRRWDEDSARLQDAAGGVNRAPGLGPGLLNQGPAGVGDAMREMSADPRALGRSPRRPTYPEPVLVIDPRSVPSDEYLQELNNRGYNILVAPVADVRVFGAPWQLFTAADVDLLRELSKIDEADDEHRRLMCEAARSLGDRIEQNLLGGAA